MYEYISVIIGLQLCCKIPSSMKAKTVMADLDQLSNLYQTEPKLNPAKTIRFKNPGDKASIFRGFLNLKRI